MTRKITALIVEDHEAVREEIKERLTSLGHDFVTASHQQEAEEHLERTRFDYILLDLCIPIRQGALPREQNGRNLLIHIRQKPGYELNRVPVLVVTGIGKEGPRPAVDLMILGASDFINKPFPDGAESLEASIRGALQRVSSTVTEAGIKVFKGGVLIFFPDRVELQFDGLKVTVCGDRSDASIRKILDLLFEKAKMGDRKHYDGKLIAEAVKIGAGGENAVRLAFHGFRALCKKRLHKHSYSCGTHDIVQSDRPGGYQFNEAIEVRQADPPLTIEGLSEKQNEICRLLQRGSMTAKSIADGLVLPVRVVQPELESLLKAKAINLIGVGTKSLYVLPAVTGHQA